MIDTTDHEEHDHPVRRILRSLPKINAPEGLDNLLERRLAEEQSEPPSFLEAILRPRRVPVYAVSVITIAMMSVFAYYLFVQRTAAPEQVQRREMPRQQPTVSQPPQRQAAAQADESHRSSQRLASTDTARREELRVSSPSESVSGEIDSRLLREVGGTGSQRTQPSDLPFLKVVPGNPVAGPWMDSVARADSLRKDSLKHAGERRQKISR